MVYKHIHKLNFNAKIVFKKGNIYFILTTGRNMTYVLYFVSEKVIYLKYWNVIWTKKLFALHYQLDFKFILNMNIQYIVQATFGCLFWFQRIPYAFDIICFIVNYRTKKISVLKLMRNDLSFMMHTLNYRSALLLV